MDNQCDLNNTFVDQQLNAERLHYQSLRGGNNIAQPVPCHEKIKILFDIVR